MKRNVSEEDDDEIEKTRKELEEMKQKVKNYENKLQRLQTKKEEEKNIQRENFIKNAFRGSEEEEKEEKEEKNIQRENFIRNAFRGSLEEEEKEEEKNKLLTKEERQFFEKKGPIDSGIIIYGGKGNDTYYLYDVDTGDYESYEMTERSRYKHAAVSLPDGCVLFIGGCHEEDPDDYCNNILKYDPNDNSFKVVYEDKDFKLGYSMAAVLLKNGKVFICGGKIEQGASDSCFLFDVENNTLTAAPLLLQNQVYEHSVSLLENGNVFVVGGFVETEEEGEEGVDLFEDTLIYDIETGENNSGPSMLSLRRAHTATTLPDGEIFIFGGENSDDDNANSTSDYVNLDKKENDRFHKGPTSDVSGKSYHFSVLLPDGRVFIGGEDNINTDLVTLIYTQKPKRRLEQGKTLQFDVASYCSGSFFRKNQKNNNNN